jgi:ATP-binding cassette subfamily B protein
MILWPVVTLVMNVSVISVLWFGGNMVIGGSLGIGKIMAFINYLTQIMNSLIQVVNLVMTFSRAKASADRINEVLNAVPVIKDNSKAQDMKHFDIEFRNVFFRYNEHSENVLEDISFRIVEGEKIGIIGATGSGKSSLVSLIPRLYDVTKGQVLVGEIDVRDIKLKDLRENIGIVLQDSTLFSGTIEDNIRFGNHKAEQTSIENAARDAQAIDFINEKENTFQHYVEQRGKNLSGGQKQRITIARALLRNPKILILDDSASSLDMATEAKLQTAIKQKMSDITIVTIAQRISAVKDADKIIVLDNGRVSAIGTHRELIEDNEIYRSIAVSQLGEEVLLNA